MTYTPKHASPHKWKESFSRSELRRDGAPLDGTVQIPGHGRHQKYGRHGGEICYRFNDPSIPRLVGLHEKENPAK
jgi:hypothetical protein